MKKNPLFNDYNILVKAFFLDSQTETQPICISAIHQKIVFVLLKNSESNGAMKLLVGFVIIIILYLIYILATTGPIAPSNRGRMPSMVMPVPADAHGTSVMV
jgi:hypothetical protein